MESTNLKYLLLGKTCVVKNAATKVNDTTTDDKIVVQASDVPGHLAQLEQVLV